MSLIRCSECGKEISDKANTCPHCGAPVEKSETAAETPKAKVWYDVPDTNQESGFLDLISLLFPLLGIIMYCIMSDKDAAKAEGIYKYSKVGIIVALILIGIWLIFLANGCGQSYSDY